jgi:hypothetical protein
MKEDFTKLPIVELERRVLAAGEFLFAADLEGGVEGEVEWLGVINRTMRELLSRGSEGESTVSRLLTSSNPEVALSAASVALDAGLDSSQARATLKKLMASSTANGWPAHYATKVMWRYREK